MTTDERHGLPSASALGRYKECPASFQMEQRIPEIDTDESSRGTLLHGITSGFLVDDPRRNKGAAEAYKTLEYDEKLAVQTNIDLYKKTIADIWEIQKLNDTVQLIEERLSFYGLFSGQPDALIIAGKWAFLREWKYGVQPVPEVSRNLQTACYALLVFNKYPSIEAVDIIISSPLAMGKKMSHGVFERKDLEAVQAQIIKIFVNCLQPNAPFAKEIGDCCQFCRAKSICKLHIHNAEEVSSAVDTEVSVSENTLVNKDNIVECAKRNESFKAKLATAKKYSEALDAQIIRVAKANPDCGIIVSRRLGNRKFDTMKTFVVLKEKFGFLPDEFVPLTKVGIGDLKNAVAKKLEISTGKANQILESIDGIYTQELGSETYSISLPQIEQNNE